MQPKDSLPQTNFSRELNEYTPFFLYKQSIFDRRPENCLSFSKNSPQKIV